VPEKLVWSVDFLTGKAPADCAKDRRPARHTPPDGALRRIGLDTPKLPAVGLLVLYRFLAEIFACTVLAQKPNDWPEIA
jgi:hypothetical protein